MICFEAGGVRVVNEGYKGYDYMPWEKILYAYYTHTSKGHSVLILSPEELDCQKAKLLLKQTHTGNYILVTCGFSPTPTVLRIKELVKQRVPNVHTF